MFDKKILLQHIENRERTQEQKLKEAMEPHHDKAGIYGRNPERIGEGRPIRGRSKAHIVPHEKDEGKHVYSQLPFKGERESIGLLLPLPKGAKMGDTVTNDKHLNKIQAYLKDK